MILNDQMFRLIFLFNDIIRIFYIEFSFSVTKVEETQTKTPHFLQRAAAAAAAAAAAISSC